MSCYLVGNGDPCVCAQTEKVTIFATTQPVNGKIQIVFLFGIRAFTYQHMSGSVAQICYLSLEAPIDSWFGRIDRKKE